MALDAVDPHLYTVATLTGHACLTVGVGYSIGEWNLSINQTISGQLGLLIRNEVV